MIDRDFAAGAFIGGMFALMIAGIMQLFDLLGLSPLTYVVILDIILIVDAGIDKYKENCEKENRKKKKKRKTK